MKPEGNTSIVFMTGQTGTAPAIMLRDNGDVLIKGKVIENDKELVEAMRQFLKDTGHLK